MTRIYWPAVCTTCNQSFVRSSYGAACSFLLCSYLKLFHSWISNFVQVSARDSEFCCEVRSSFIV